MKKTLILDSSQLQSFLDCPQYWYYLYQLNLVPRVVEPKEAMMKGSYGHKLLEFYYKNKFKGMDIAGAILASERHDIDAECNCVCGHAATQHFVHSLGNTKLETCILCSGTGDYQHAFERGTFPLSQPARLQVIDRFRMYALTHERNDFRPHSEESIEVGFSEPIYEDSEHLFILEGKIDMLCSLGLENIIVDHKFQERAHTLYKKSIQFRNYSMVTGTKLMVINYIRMAASAQKPFERVLVAFSADEHVWWRRELVKIYFSILSHLENVKDSRLTLPESHKWNHCKGQWGQPCEFTDLCEEREQDHIINIKIKNNFVKKEEWRPW